MSKLYAIEVSDANGWDDGCTDWDGVFFGDQIKAPGSLGMVEKALIVAGAKERDAILRNLNTDGDWRIREYDDEDNLTSDDECRPTYSHRPINSVELEALAERAQ